MVPQYMINKSKIFGNTEVFRNLLEKRSLLMTPSFIFDDIINKVVSGQQIMHQSREPLNYLIDRHHFTMVIAGQDFNCMSCLDLEMLEGRHICFLQPLFQAYLLAHNALERIRKKKSQKIFSILTQPSDCGHLHIVDNFVQTSRCLLFKGFTLTWKI